MTTDLPVSRTGATDREVEAHGRKQPDYRWAAEHDQARQEALAAIAAERTRQDEKWGQQNHPDGTGPHVRWTFPGMAASVARVAQATTDVAARLGEVTWLDILREEVAEAFAEEDPVKLRTELVQVAAVATQWVEAIDRRDALLAEQPGGGK